MSNSTQGKTYNAKPLELERTWWVVDAEGQTLGRLATQVANLLRGKNKPQYTPHIDSGDFVIVINAEKITVTGKKAEQKKYYNNSGYPGGMRVTVFKDYLATRPTKVLERAIRGMLPHNRLGDRQFTKLNVYVGPEHPHAAQQAKQYKLISKEAAH